MSHLSNRLLLGFGLVGLVLECFLPHPVHRADIMTFLSMLTGWG
jgi:hypothetical protein